MEDFRPIPLEPIGERVIVRRDRTEKKKSESGLILVGSNSEQKLSTKSSIGTVVAVGPDLKQVKLGDRVYIGVNYGYPIDYSAGPEDEEDTVDLGISDSVQAVNNQNVTGEITNSVSGRVIVQDKAEYVVLREIDIQYIIKD